MMGLQFRNHNIASISTYFSLFTFFHEQVGKRSWKVVALNPNEERNVVISAKDLISETQCWVTVL